MVKDWQLTILCVAALSFGVGVMVFSVGRLIAEVRKWKQFNRTYL